MTVLCSWLKTLTELFHDGEHMERHGLFKNSSVMQPKLHKDPVPIVEGHQWGFPGSFSLNHST